MFSQVNAFAVEMMLTTKNLNSFIVAADATTSYSFGSFIF